MGVPKGKINPEKLTDLPELPGVYIMKDSNDNVIYIGKARNIRKRVSSYFVKHTELSIKLQKLIREVTNIEYKVVRSESEALILEATLIRHYKPKYNILLKYGIRYPYIRITIEEAFPRIVITRVKSNPKSLYFGPYSSVKKMRHMLKIIQRYFPLRSCSIKLEEGKTKRKRPCLDFYLGRCPAPCTGNISHEKYMKTVEELIMFLKGDRKGLIEKLRDQMHEYAKELKFEEAAYIRDKINAIASTPINNKVLEKRDNSQEEMEELRKALKLKRTPEFIEGIDISNLFGNEAVGSVVTFRMARPYKKGYRRYKIKTINGINDYSMIKEVVYRRYKRTIKDGGIVPDLILIDGGKGQLSSAIESLNELNLELNVISLAKKEELIFTPYSSEPIRLPRDSHALHLLQRVRDEAHRFAVSYHRRLRDKKIRKSVLDSIQGIGKKRKETLLLHFGSISRIKSASIEEISQVDGIGKELAKRIKEALR